MDNPHYDTPRGEGGVAAPHMATRPARSTARGVDIAHCRGCKARVWVDTDGMGRVLDFDRSGGLHRCPRIRGSRANIGGRISA